MRGACAVAMATCCKTPTEDSHNRAANERRENSSVFIGIALIGAWGVVGGRCSLLDIAQTRSRQMDIRYRYRRCGRAGKHGKWGGKVLPFGSAVWPGRHSRAEKKKRRPAVQSAASEE